jgi:uncharacterized cupin superfamily protein
MVKGRIMTNHTLSVVNAQLEPLPAAPEDIVSGDPQQRFTILWSSDDKKLYNGIWHCTPGVFYMEHPDETITLLEGRATVTFPDGDTFEVKAGDMGFIPAGTRAKWEVHETVRKSFHCHDATGTVLGEL